MHSTRQIIGRTTEKDSLDYYTTDPKAVDLFLKQLIRDHFYLPNRVTEPCCGSGNISEVLKNYDIKVTSYDLCDRGYVNCQRKDFFHLTKAKNIITNFPYTNQTNFISHGLEIVDDYLICITRTQFLSGVNKQEIYKKRHLQYIYQYIKRIKMFPGNNPQLARGMIDYCWLIFNKKYNGEPTFRWIGENHENI